MDDSALNALCFSIFGIGAFFWGFMRFRRKRLIENIPTSTIRGMAMGLVELIGKAVKQIDLVSPFTNLECVYYKYRIERYQRSGRSSRWVTIASGDSSFAPFFLDDGSGRVLVSPQGAEMILSADYEFTTGLGKALPGALIQFMERSNISYRNIFGYDSLRFTEWHLLPGDTVYVMGAAMKSPDFRNRHNEKVEARLLELKQNPVKITEADLDKNGEISMEEWNRAKDRIERETLEEIARSPQQSELDDVVVARGETEKIFIISDRSEKDLTLSLTVQSFAGIFGGTVVALAGIIFVLIRLRLVQL